ncbi:MAG: TMEM175 family protein [Planctomycetota bacterium]
MLRGLVKSNASHDGMGFRLRGLEMTRLETFVDAAFAFSVTMLALSPDNVPRTFDEMMVLFKGIPAFLTSLAMLLLFWNGHVRMSSRYGLDDGVSRVLSGAFIAVMLVYVYPLKFMVGSFFENYIPALRTPTFFNSIGSAQSLSTMFIVMSSGFVGMNVMLTMHDLYALKMRKALAFTMHEIKVVRCEVGASLVYIAFGVASLMIAIALRSGAGVVWAGFVYAGLGAAIPLYWTVFGPSKAEISDARAQASEE